MFEKSLYDLIRGLRSHKGNERNYILESLKECRNEAKSQDLDIKATAILKLIYLDMFGHDMAWASFHALEVMSSPKFRQKRVGYLAAVQSFRLDTDVLMLTTNLIKKDLNSSSIPEMSLAINGLSHIVSPSLARDLAPDLVARLSHSSPHIRKKAVLVLYKCFLQSPELLRTCWPRLRDCLSDEESSVVGATVNVVCELARRNPKNYLPLAPQLFKLLTDSGNNWMTIKLIKLFSTLTPLEPRLVKKLIPPITNLIRTTPAMSLLYECISGLIEGGLLAGIPDPDDAEELASVCVTKLRGFLVEGDSNLKYVGLLALTKLVGTHSHLVSMHQDVILDCIDDPDISIRYRALELVVGMVDLDSLPVVVGKLMRQLKPDTEMVELEGQEEEEDDDMQEEMMHPRKPRGGAMVSLELPEEYKRTIIERILKMCSRDMYANVADFEWYLDVLVQLVKYAPPIRGSGGAAADDEDGESARHTKDVGEDIGKELRNVVVRVRSMRPEAVSSAEILLSRRDGVFPAAGGGGVQVLGPAAWIAGEYSSFLNDPSSTMDHLLHPSSAHLPTEILCIYLQSIPKVYSALTCSTDTPWDSARKSILTLLTSRITRFLIPLSLSPHLEIQERSVEFLELFRLVAEAISAHPTDTETETYDPPLLLTSAIPSLFSGQDLNPVAPGAQRKVPAPPTLDLTEPINPDLARLLSSASTLLLDQDADLEDKEFHKYYYVRPSTSAIPASASIDAAARSSPAPYQPRNRDDPFYIFTPAAAEEADIDAIPIVPLQLDDVPAPVGKPKRKKKRERVEIVADESLEGEEPAVVATEETGRKSGRKGNRGLLQVDASRLDGYSLEAVEGEEVEDEEDERDAKVHVERLRREMEAAAAAAKERETAAKPKKKKKKAAEGEDGKKKKKKKAATATATTTTTITAEGEVAVKTRMKKKKQKDPEKTPL